MDKQHSSEKSVSMSASIGSSLNPTNKKSFDLGSIYTPDFLARWVASVMFEYMPKIPKPVILDPACGAGALLEAVDLVTNGDSELIGIDLSSNAIEEARRSCCKIKKLKIADAIQPIDQCSFLEGWAALLDGKTVDAIIANPPWGADLAHSRKGLLKAGYISWVDNVISSAQALEPMRSLQKIDAQKIKPLIV